MPPTLHLVRHAQGFHNVPPENYNLHDPEITELGKEQCRQIRSSFPYTEGVELVVASPLKRTLQTALHGFGNILIRDSSRIIAIPEFQETSAAPCDTGSSVPVLTKHFAADPVDFDAVPADWNCKRGKWGPHEKEIQKRAHVARSWLKSRQEKEIVVVSHGGFLHYLTEDWASANKFPGTGWRNCEFRSYKFVPGSTDDSVEELDESRSRRAGRSKPLGESELRTHAEATQHSTEGLDESLDGSLDGSLDDRNAQ